MRLLEHGIVGVAGGLLYVGVELLYRGRSHVSMFFVGGLCFWAIGMLDRAAPGLPLTAQAVLGAGLEVWDYSGCPLNLCGQICLPYSLLWIPLSLAAALTDDLLRFLLFRQPFPPYRWLL